ncbi:MAG: hypothetical protein BJ554DRAFT_6205 [Olpidium bornovanus]|uniref:VPS9 domain-containing protein n=1 Tax=Olpidium bornovanus TaxID=278681 RepID=A0A8H7ZY84_9FUNG|nr:MAG: hypothetical protein BJ554DRAFT_6205 [Olpidium bornovanus]
MTSDSQETDASAPSATGLGPLSPAVSPLPKQTSSSADIVLPLLIYLVVKSNPPKLISNLRFIQYFRYRRAPQGEASYCLTNLCAAVSFLENVDIAALGLPQSESIVFSREIGVKDDETRQELILGSAQGILKADLANRVGKEIAGVAEGVAGAGSKVFTGVVDMSSKVFGKLTFWSNTGNPDVPPPQRKSLESSASQPPAAQTGSSQPAESVTPESASAASVATPLKARTRTPLAQKISLPKFASSPSGSSRRSTVSSAKSAGGGSNADAAGGVEIGQPPAQEMQEMFSVRKFASELGRQELPQVAAKDTSSVGRDSPLVGKMVQAMFGENRFTSELGREELSQVGGGSAKDVSPVRDALRVDKDPHFETPARSRDSKWRAAERPAATATTGAAGTDPPADPEVLGRVCRGSANRRCGRTTRGLQKVGRDSDGPITGH